MRSEEEIRAQRDRIMVAANAEPGTIPDGVRLRSQDLCHVFTWILDETTSIPPYSIPGGCCCNSKKVVETGDSAYCALGPYMCLMQYCEDRNEKPITV